ncbi:phage tail protein [Liquorilactobacillus nagelii]|uniref:phage tail protein n=1 Tax=Liquorilactobacillus nagelii TaxID=82688 RepID=UPI001CCC97B2|nr:phage tail protein [Liquorilactobacillus nagelii]ULQ49061.1 phage tail protein [Liquorilactobacillus nagelii]
MLWVQDVNGDQTPIIAYNIAITETLSSFDQLSFVFLVDPNDEQDPNYVAVDMMVPRTIVTEPTTGKKFMILQSNPVSVGDKVQYTVTCTSVGYKLHDNYVTETVTNTQTLKACMDMITSDTSFSYQIDGTFANYSFSETFGGGYSDNLLTQLASDFGFEFYFDNYVIHIKSTIGNSGAFLFVDGANAGKISIQEDYSTITTYIKGNGKQNDDGTYACSAEYTSPAATTWGKIWAEPYQSDSITDVTTLATKLKSQIHDYPDVQYSMDYVDFKNSLQGFNNDTSVGNYGYLRNRFGIDISIRVQSRTYYPQDTKNTGSITFGNKIFDPNVYINKMREAYQENAALGKKLKQGLLTLDQYYKKLKIEYDSQNNLILSLQKEVNEVSSEGIFIDVSSNNENDSTEWFAKLANYGAKGLIVKLTQSTDYTNPLAAAQIANGKLAGLDLVGCYHYFMGNGTAEGQYFLTQLQANNVPKAAVVALNVGDSSIALSKNNLDTEILNFLQVLIDAGYTGTCVYAEESWFGSKIDYGLGKYDWVASTTSLKKPSGASAWQFDNNWKGENVDANYGYNSLFV